MICSSLNLVFFTSVSSRRRTLAQTGGVSGEHVTGQNVWVDVALTSNACGDVIGKYGEMHDGWSCHCGIPTGVLQIDPKIYRVFSKAKPALLNLARLPGPLAK